MAREVNLVPDIKDEMIRTLKLRNFIFFLCIIVAAASIGITALTGLILGGQQLAVDSKKATIEDMSAKINSYSDLSDFLTIKDQLGNLNTLTSDKNVLSRTFNILSAMIPTGADTITISELNVSLEEGQPNFNFEAQANAGSAPFIDYNVLDSFKKSMEYLSYDYGNYVDKDGNTIPAYCMIETGTDGALFRNESKDIYAYWTIKGDGCNPDEDGKTDGYSIENYEGQDVVRIWRTPQFNEWYKENPKDDEPQISLDGTISNVPHFESSCITYSGDDSASSSKPKWTETNETCKLVPDGLDGIRIVESSNGRGQDDELVLRFTAIVNLNPEVYKFSNHHMMTIAPTGRRNVTDSYVQVQAMFGERAADCEDGDAACNTTPTNKEGEN